MIDRRTLMAAGAVLTMAGPIHAREEKAMYGLVGRIKATAGKRAELAAILLEGTGEMPGCLSYIVAEDMADADPYAEEVVAKLKAAGIRAETDTRNEKINYKVREHSLAKVPVLLVVGKKEAAERTVSIRRLGSDGQQVMKLDEAIAMLKAEATPPDLR